MLSKRRTPIQAASHERILRIATRLFAEHGYHGVSAREIAAATGLNIATVHYHTGGKRELYMQILRSLYQEEQAWVTGVLDHVGADVVKDAQALKSVLGELLDTLIELLQRDLTRPRLYMRRWLEERDELTPFEAELSIAVYKPLYELLAQAQQVGTIRADLDLNVFLRSFYWMLYGYFVTGPVDWTAWWGDPNNRENLQAFKAYLHMYLITMLGLAPTA
ncbi:TetR/AcrR family transcriptional regulator [Ktedonosporobacter rubrisoli]|nr:TetR/AcrR family transcriptional regulator [Ktedonosporobacter rubrisoli]